MSRSPRELRTVALDALLRNRVAAVAASRDWELLKEVARLAQSDAPLDLAATDAALFVSWRNAVTRFHLCGWSNMTPERIDQVLSPELAPGSGKPHAMSSGRTWVRHSCQAPLKSSFGRTRWTGAIAAPIANRPF